MAYRVFVEWIQLTLWLAQGYIMPVINRSAAPESLTYRFSVLARFCHIVFFLSKFRANVTQDYAEYR